MEILCCVRSCATKDSCDCPCCSGDKFARRPSLIVYHATSPHRPSLGIMTDALVWDNVGESHFAMQSTCRGAQCMFKYRCLVEDGRLAQPPVGEGAMPPLLDGFSKTAAGMPALM